MEKNILVVDDEKDIRDFLRNLLVDNGYQVRLAEDGVRAMELVMEDKPDLILLDLMMPQETGTGFYRKIRDKEIPVIVISGVAGRNIAVSKIVPVFDKPIDETSLLKAVDDLMGRRSLGWQ